MPEFLAGVRTLSRRVPRDVSNSKDFNDHPTTLRPHLAVGGSHLACRRHARHQLHYFSPRDPGRIRPSRPREVRHAEAAPSPPGQSVCSRLRHRVSHPSRQEPALLPYFRKGLKSDIQLKLACKDMCITIYLLQLVFTFLKRSGLGPTLLSFLDW